MQDLYLRTEVLKSNLENKDFKEIRKIKVKSLKSENSSSTYQNYIKSYNYYVKLIKKIKKYISNNNCELIFDTLKDRFNNTICLVTTFDPNELDISMTIDIRLIIGNSRDTFMKCSYYNLRLCFNTVLISRIILIRKVGVYRLIDIPLLSCFHYINIVLYIHLYLT